MKSDREPARFPASVYEKLWAIAKRGSDHVNPTVVVQIAKGGAASRDRYVRAGVAFFEVSFMVHGQQGRILVAQGSVVLLHIVEYVALDDEGIFPTIIVEILEAYSPTGGFSGERAEPGFDFLGAEAGVAVIMKGDVRLVRELRDEKVRKAIVVVILECDTHAGEHFTVAGQCRA